MTFTPIDREHWARHEPVSTDGVESTHKGLQQMADMTQEIIEKDLWSKYR